MKKVNTRSILLTTLILASALSYIYLNTVTIPDTSKVVESKEAVQEDVKTEVDGEQKELILPDVQLLKKVVQTGKRFLPASS